MEKNMNDKPLKLKNGGLKETKSFWGEVYEWIDSIVITVMVILVVFTFLFRQVKIDGGSMDSATPSEN